MILYNGLAPGVVSRTISRFKDIAYSGCFRSDGRLVVAGGQNGIVQVGRKWTTAWRIGGVESGAWWDGSSVLWLLGFGFGGGPPGQRRGGSVGHLVGGAGGGRAKWALGVRAGQRESSTTRMRRQGRAPRHPQPRLHVKI